MCDAHAASEGGDTSSPIHRTKGQSLIGHLMVLLTDDGLKCGHHPEPRAGGAVVTNEWTLLDLGTQ